MDWEKEFKRIEFDFIRRFQRKPSLEAMLLLIGFQESPQTKTSQSKEEKMDLINLGLMVVMEKQGFFRRLPPVDNWPAFEPTDRIPGADKEAEIRQGIVHYFRENPV